MIFDRLSAQLSLPLTAGLLIATAAFSSYSSLATAADVTVKLTGAQEVPSAISPGIATGTITVGTDRSVSGSVMPTGIAGTMAHIHEAATGKNGPVVIPLTKNGDSYEVPAGARLTEAQFASFKAGNFYVNVHTAANPSGEIRAQLKP